jgi:hypothetical protein
MKLPLTDLVKVMGVSNMFGMRINQPKATLVKILTIFVPVFLIAHFTKNMVYVLPTLAIGVMFGLSLNPDTQKKDDEGEGDPGD